MGLGQWLGDIGFLGSGTGAAAKSGWGELAMTGLGAGLNYKQAKDDRKDRLKMFDKQFGAEQKQIDFQNSEYLSKRADEDEAWSKFENPYANIV